MADISSITLPDGVTYNLKDQVARNASGSPPSYDVVTPSFSSLPKTFYNEHITAQHTVIGKAIHLSNPSAGDIDWNVTCASGSLTISGTFHGSTATTATMSLWIPTQTLTLTTS